MTVKNQVKVGPWGSNEPGNRFEFIPNGRITKIHIKASSCIDSIAFTYNSDCDCKSYQSPTYGGTGGQASEMTIDTDEEIQELSGTIGIRGLYVVVTSLCFKTNKKTCQFGSKTNEKFSLPVDAKTGKFVGFHGRSGSYLDAIGAFLVPKQ